MADTNGAADPADEPRLQVRKAGEASEAIIVVADRRSISRAGTASRSIATALRERRIREITVDHEAVALRRRDGEFEPPSSGRPIDVAGRYHEAATIARAYATPSYPASLPH